VVLRDRAFDDLAAAISAAHRGEPVISSARLGALLSHRSAQIRAGLTLRETTVLALMADGLSNEAIAQQLVVTLNTVRNHVQRILTKLSSHSKLEAVAEAARRGLLPPRP
jgi:two-component system, NarL family, nitrate/nitrite response regulator NarL